MRNVKRFQAIWLVLLLLSHCYGIAVDAVDRQADLHTDLGHEIMLHAKSAEMRNFMLPKVKPCDDYYKHACGNWAKLNPAGAHEITTDIFTVLNKAYKRRVIHLLNGPRSSAENAMTRRVRYFYESCVNRVLKEREIKEKILRILEEYGGMPALSGDAWNESKFDWLEICAQILHKYGKQIIIGVKIAADLFNNEVNRLYIGQLEDLQTSRAEDYYRLVQSSLILELEHVLGFNLTYATQTAAEMAKFELELAAGVADSRDGLGFHEKSRLRLLDEMSEAYKPSLNLTQFVKTWLGYEYRLPVYEYVESYLPNLSKVIEKTPKRVVANYIMWKLWSEFYIKDEDEHEVRVDTCIKLTVQHFFKYLDHIVYHNILQNSAGSVQSLRELWRLLKTAFEHEFKSNETNWLSKETRESALQKLSAMQLEINSFEVYDFETDYGDLVTTTENYFENLRNFLELRGRNFRQRIQEPSVLDFNSEMHYTPVYASEYNKVFLPVIFLQPYFLWDDAYPAALKFSTIGYIIGHEMAHGFDNQMRNYDAKGNLRAWWDRNSTAEFVARRDCLRRQFAKLRYGWGCFPDMKAQDENIADNVGVRIAYHAYTNWLAENNTRLYGESLPNLDTTPQQLFFLGLAQFWCTDVRPFWRSLLISTDTHAPKELRVQAMLANFDEFANAYQCRAGSNMHPSHKCVIY